jgi:hypothetical protein
MDFVLVLLQADEPPAAYAHGQKSEDSTENDAGDPSNPSTSRQRDEYAATRVNDQYNSKN